MVERVVQRLPRRAQLGEVDDPPRVVSHLALHVDLDPEGVAVEPGALVVGRDVGQPMGRLEPELPEQLDHAIPITLWVWTFRRHWG